MAKKNEVTHKEFRKDINEIKVTMARIDEGVKRINGTVDRHETAIQFNSKLNNQNSNAIAGIKGKITMIAGGVSLAISAIITAAFSYFKQ